MNKCDWLVAATYVAAATVIWFAVSVRCRATMADIERHCMRRGVAAWYAFRGASVVVIAGGLMYVRLAAAVILGHIWTAVFG